ncbi:MAG: hypothetical protein K2J92_08320 [Muribaculaceae bacterium]|nr:hypothetical protein [Muribaculaceae bacterium]MDE6803241.1 hypothetical protein [Muribaculaceae bacterium]
MKIKQLMQLGLGVLAAAGTTACQNHFDDPGLVTPVAQLKPNTTIAEFKSIFADEPNQLCPYKEDGTPYIISGRVISSDATGNIYQSLCIQDETSAMTFAIRRAGLYDYYHLGQEVVVNLSDLWVGQYNYLMQIGWLGESSTGVAQMSRVDFTVFQTHTELNGVPEPSVRYVDYGATYPDDSMYCIISEIDRLPSAPGEDFYNLQGQLVEFRNVSFEDGGELTYAPYQENANRYILQEGNSLKLCVRNSGYATFYNDVLPEGTGTVRGILSYYASDPSYATTDGSINGWQLLIRSLDDVEFDEEGTKLQPYTIEEAKAQMNKGRNAWVSGYIVGSVKGGVTTVTSNDDIIFSNDAEMTNNLVIGPTADCRDFNQCMTVSLPQGTALRKYANLMDNPAVYGRPMIVRGLIDMFLGLPGISGSGEADTFEIDGIIIDPDTPDNPSSTVGDGSESSPFSVTQVIDGTATGSDVWVEGYIVGTVTDKSWPADVEFSAANASNTNIIISVSPAGEATTDNSIPVQLPAGDVRNALSLQQHPDNLGMKVKLRGSIEKYFGVIAVKSVSEYSLDGGTVTPPDNPSTTVGNGTEDSPFGVSQIKDGTATGSDVWVEGYIVGTVTDKSWPSDVEFSAANASNTNIIISVSPVGEATTDNSIPVQLPAGDVRNALSLQQHPENLGIKVKLRGSIEKYFGLMAMKSISEYVIEP